MLIILFCLFAFPGWVYSLGAKEQVVKTLSGVTKVVLRSGGTLHITQGGDEKIETHGTDYQLSKLKTAVYGDTLVLSIEGIQTGLNRGNIEYYLTLETISGVENYSTGDILGGPIRSEKVKVIVNSTGNITLSSLDAGRVFIESNGSGDVQIQGGSCGIQYVTLNSTGDYHAPSLKSSRSEVRVDGSGSAVIWVTDNLDAVLLGSGDLEYYGEPVLDREVNKGTGSIRALGKK